jgi:hypothetical protein
MIEFGSFSAMALVEGTNIVRREIGLPEARVRAAHPRLWFAGRNPSGELRMRQRGGT